MTATRHPPSISSAFFRASRVTLARNFWSQNSVLLLGVVVREHSRCRCQKQPCTNMTALCLRITMSGRPGKSRGHIRNRNPRLCSSFRSNRSGAVLAVGTDAIILERVRVFSMSSPAAPVWKAKCESSVLFCAVSRLNLYPRLCIRQLLCLRSAGQQRTRVGNGNSGAQSLRGLYPHAARVSEYRREHGFAEAHVRNAELRRRVLMAVDQIRS